MDRRNRLGLLLLGLVAGCASHGQGSTRTDGAPATPLAQASPTAPAEDTFPLNVDNLVQLLPSCTDGNSLSFFQGQAGKIDLPRGKVTRVKVPNLWGTYRIGFQVNGWYWRCGGAATCPNLGGCQNPDNAGQVGIVVTPDAQRKGCTSATLDPSWSLGLCDADVPAAGSAVTVTLVDPATCTVKVTASGLDRLAPSPDCCDCRTCKSPPGSQTTHCR